MLVAGSNRRIFGLDSHAGIAVTGLSADGRQLVNRAREEAQSYADSYGSKVVPSILANRLALYMHYFTLHASLRPFGSTALIAAYDEDLKTPELYMMEPSGVCFRYFGCAAGKGAQAAKTELEKLLTKFTDPLGSTTITAREAVAEIAKMLVASPFPFLPQLPIIPIYHSPLRLMLNLTCSALCVSSVVVAARMQSICDPGREQRQAIRAGVRLAM